ncbi:MAG: InlB B-repeat-containing protein, partial [Clostridiales bacterium]|nr:InlB B-repeat-containing protein [Clostridiales bacterium]
MITYKVVNTGTSDISINLGSIGEIMLDNESKVPMSVNGNCLLAYDSDNSIALAVMPDDGSFTTRWIGSGSSIYSQFTYGFEDTTDTDYNTGSSKYSAGMSWSFDVNVPAGETVTKGVRFYAGDIDVVKITFDGNGGEGEMTDQVVFGGSPAKLHENKFTKADHKFKGWALSSTAKTVDYGDKESVSGLTSDTKLYAVWKENPTPTITAKDLKFTYGDTGSKVGASTNGDGALSYSVTSGDDVISVDSDGNITILQAGDAKIKISSAATSDYKATSKTINVTVDKKSVDITIDDASKDWGSDDPVFTYTKSVDGCSLEGMPAREEGEDVGEYDIKAGSLAVARGSSTNYKLGKITKGKFTINEVSVDVTIDYCDGEAPEVVPSSASIPLKVYLERKADSKTYEGRTIVGWYTDADYTTEYDSSVPLGKTPIKLYAKWGDVSYSFTEGEDSVWTQGSDEGLTFKASRNVGDEFTFGHFKGVKVDGDELDASDYTAESGSVIVTLGVDFLTDLDVGTHTITLMF